MAEQSIVKEKVGQRVLGTLKGTWNHGPIEEYRILEVSPSGGFTRVMDVHGRKFWRATAEVALVEVLGGAEPNPGKAADRDPGPAEPEESTPAAAAVVRERARAGMQPVLEVHVQQHAPTGERTVMLCRPGNRAFPICTWSLGADEPFALYTGAAQSVRRRPGVFELPAVDLPFGMSLRSLELGIRR